MLAKNQTFFLFYAATIAGVLILFNRVTAYGETQVEAPQLIAGKYQLDLQTVPACLDAKNVSLDLEQSGIYLFGNLAIDKEKIKLDGKINNGKVALSGRSDRIGTCKANAKAPPEIAISGQAKDRTFEGEIKWNLDPTMIKLKGNLEAAPQTNEEKH